MMKNPSYLIGILVTIAIGTYLYFTLCSDCRLAVAEQEPVQEEVAPIAVPEPSSFPFEVSEGNYTINVNDNFNFNLSSNTLLMPLSVDVENGVDSLKDYLADNMDKAIDITGLYGNDEENPSAFPNLGLARANAVKNHLVSQGIPSAQTNTFGKLMNDLVPSEKTLLGPVTYAISQSSETAEEDLKALYDEIKANPLVLYFNTGEAAINLTAEQRQKVANITKYLDKVENATCNVIGHTDNTGGRINNITLGQERADFAMAYLIRNGIPASKIKSNSEGPDNPIASNATEDGRAKNRRTVVTLN